VTVRRVDYDAVSPHYEQRYARNRWDDVESYLLEFVGDPPQRVLEVGCGTGHWLRWLAQHRHRAVGLDRSRGMLAEAGESGILGTAERLPFGDASFDRVIAVNALHHFPDPQAFIHEAARTLKSPGALLTIGLDPHTGLDRWSIYEYFDAALELDRQRYQPTAKIRDWMRSAGLDDPRSEVAMHRPVEREALALLESGGLDQNVTSQLLVLSVEQYAAGIATIRRDAERARSRGETLMLRSDLRLYATRASR
jgi:ubiquinone/menaquinone biosynthesis C-methylase UbiE